MGRSRVKPKQSCDNLLEFNAPPTMTVLAITDFEILVEDAGTYAHITADVDVVVGSTYHDGYQTVPTACEAKVLLSDDTDLDALQHAVLVSDVVRENTYSVRILLQLFPLDHAR